MKTSLRAHDNWTAENPVRLSTAIVQTESYRLEEVIFLPPFQDLKYHSDYLDKKREDGRFLLTVGGSSDVQVWDLESTDGQIRCVGKRETESNRKQSDGIVIHDGPVLTNQTGPVFGFVEDFIEDYGYLHFHLY